MDKLDLHLVAGWALFITFADAYLTTANIAIAAALSLYLIGVKSLYSWAWAQIPAFSPERAHSGGRAGFHCVIDGHAARVASASSIRAACMAAVDCGLGDFVGLSRT